MSQFSNNNGNVIAGEGSNPSSSASLSYLEAALVQLKKHSDLSAEEREKVAEETVTAVLRYAGLLERDLVNGRNKAILALKKDRDDAVEEVKRWQAAASQSNSEAERVAAKNEELKQQLEVTVQQRDAALETHRGVIRDNRKKIQDEIAKKAEETERLRLSLETYASP